MRFALAPLALALTLAACTTDDGEDPIDPVNPIRNGRDSLLTAT